MPKYPIGIYGIGAHLPPTIRKNSEWSPAFLERFREHEGQDLTTVVHAQPGDKMDPVYLELAAKYTKDPFRGSVERRVLASGLEASAMEIEAGQEALKAACVRPSEIDLLIVSSNVPDLLQSSNATVVHRGLGLRPNILSFSADMQCSSFILQMILASGMITAGAAKKALLVQSAAFSRITEYDRPYSVNFGDGATAAVVGPVSTNKGVLGWSWQTDGKMSKAVCLSPARGGPWYNGEGRLVAASLDVQAGRSVPYRLGQICKNSIEEMLEDAALTREEISFFAAHQPIAWAGELCRRSAGLTHARSCSTFEKVGSIGPANLPLNLLEGLNSNQLHDGDVVAIHATGPGFTWGSLALRWGA